MQRLRTLFTQRRARWTLLTVALLLTAVLGCDAWIEHTTNNFVFDDLDALPTNQVGLVLGTSERGRNGGPNPYFTHRMDAAIALYRAGKVRHLLVSGDNGRNTYNEPMAMRTTLIAAGVDSADITLDFAGFRTLDSVVRARAVFGQERITVISQRFHNERAVYIARRMGIDAVGFNANDVGIAQGLRTQLREKLARTKVFIDLLLGVEPHFLGPSVPLGEQVLPQGSL